MENETKKMPALFVGHGSPMNAIEDNDYDKIIKKQYKDVIDYETAGKSSELAFFTPEHFYPMLYI